jgi:hypothetical protein
VSSNDTWEGGVNQSVTFKDILKTFLKKIIPKNPENRFCKENDTSQGGGI